MGKQRLGLLVSVGHEKEIVGKCQRLDDVLLINVESMLHLQLFQERVQNRIKEEG